MREVVRGDKHNLRKSANCKAQISIMCGVNDTDLCVAICRFSQVVFVTSNNFTHNLLFYYIFPIVFSINVTGLSPFPANLPNQVADHHPGLTRKFCRLFERRTVFSKGRVGPANQFTGRYTVEQGTIRTLPYAELNRSTSTKKRAYLLILTAHPPLGGGLLESSATWREHHTSICHLFLHHRRR